MIAEGLLDMFDMIGNYEERKVANTEVKGGVIDTCRVTDSSRPFETGIQHEGYNDGQWVIVEMYDDKESAAAGHEKWVQKFSKNPPQELRDVSTCSIKKLAEAFGAPRKETHRRKRNKNGV
jgi:hypothetical protein